MGVCICMLWLAMKIILLCKSEPLHLVTAMRTHGRRGYARRVLAMRARNFRPNFSRPHGRARQRAHALTTQLGARITCPGASKQSEALH